MNNKEFKAALAAGVFDAIIGEKELSVAQRKAL